MKNKGSPGIEERRLITILFADLSGFTALSSKLDPEDVCAVANTCFEYFNKVIIKHGGAIHKYGGDLVIALFGFPLSHEDDPERAIKASLEMMALVPQVNEALASKLKRKTELGLHIGMNSGIVVVGAVGSPEKKEHTIMGDVVNLASRLKDVAQKGEIVVSEPVFRASRYLFEYEILSPVPVKGIDEPIKIFKPLGVKEKPEPKRGVKGLYSPLVGRDKELLLLKNIVTNLEGGKGGAVFILGDAGLGKSRLLEELKQSITQNEKSVTILEGRCLAYGETIPYWPFLQMLERVFDITEKDSRTNVQKKFLEKTKDIFPDTWHDLVPYIGYLFSVRFADELDEKIKYLDAEDLKIQIFVTIRKLLGTLAQRHPLMLVIEDYHWVDTTSLEFLQFLFDVPEVPPILCLVLSRVEKEKECYKTKGLLKKKLGDNFHEVILKPLDTSASTQLVYNLLKIPGIPEEFRDKILAKAEGNPFYVEEIIRSLIDSDLLIFQSGVWNLKADVSTLEIPDSVQAVIAGRLDRLEFDVREVLQMASVIGRNFYGRVLEHICELDSLVLTLYLVTLEDYEYIDTLRQKPEFEYIFRHPLLHEVIYSGLLKKRRCELHRKTGEAIEQIFKSRLDDFAELLAHQYAKSDKTEKALEWLKKAGQKAKDRYANDEAIKYFQTLILYIKENMKNREDELFTAYEALGNIYSLQGDYERAIRSYEEMHRCAGEDKILQSKSNLKLSIVYHTQSRYADALKILNQTDKLVQGDSIEEMLEKSEIYLAMCMNYGLKGEIEKAIVHGEKGLQIVEAHRPEIIQKIGEQKINELQARGFNSLATLFYFQGAYEKAIDLFERTLKLSEEIGDKQKIAVVSGNLGAMYQERGEYEKTTDLYKKFLRMSEEIGYKRGMGIASGNLGLVYYYQGEYEKTEVLYQKFLEISEEIGYKRGVGIANCNLGGLLLETNGLDKAESYLLKSKEILEEIGDKSTLISACALLAELESRRQVLECGAVALERPNKKALGYAKQAVQFAEELGSKPGQASCYFMYGKIYSTTNDFKSAEENFKKAIEMFEVLNLKKSLADVYLEYAKMLKKGAAMDLYPENSAKEYFDKALQLYEDMKLQHKIKECT